MKLTLLDQLTQYMRVFQGVLFPALQEQLGALTEKHQQVVKVLNLICLEALIASWLGGVGRPPKDRRAIARAFVAKAVYNLSTTRQLLERAAVGRRGVAAHLRLGEPAGNSSRIGVFPHVRRIRGNGTSAAAACGADQRDA